MNKNAAVSLQSSAAGADVAIRLSGVSKSYNLYRNKQDMVKAALHPRRKKYHTEFYALKNIDLEVKKGEVLGIIGRNGCGKSTLLKVISKVLTPTSGTVHTAGNVVALLELGAGFNPEFSGMENIYFYCSLLGYRKHETDKLVDEILEFADIGEFIHQPIKTYSSGMKARLAFAVSINVNPDILILDEVLAVGDELFKRKCYAKMEQFFQSGKTILFVSHSTSAIKQLCTRAVFLDSGEILIEGPTKLIARYYEKYLYATKENESKIKSEIIALNKNEKLKQAIYNRIEEDGDKKAVNGFLDDFESDNHTAAIDFGQEELEKTFKKEPYFIPDFEPITTQVLKNADINIIENKITTLGGKQVNCLIRDETYYYECVVKSNTEEENINISFSISTDKGFLVSRFGGKSGRIFIPKINKFEEYRIKIRFRCSLNSGTYYTSVGLQSCMNSEKNLLIRINDTLVFKVLPEENSLFSGLVTLEQEIFIENNDR